MTANGLWTWVEAAYARPGVEAACLELQDHHGQNVPLLLWAVWAASADPDLAREAATAARNWETSVVGQLRLARRSLKAPAPAIAEPGRERLRQDVKAAELAAERLLLEGLEMLTPARGASRSIDALRTVSAAWGAAPNSPLAELADLLASHLLDPGTGQ